MQDLWLRQNCPDSSDPVHPSICRVSLQMAQKTVPSQTSINNDSKQVTRSNTQVHWNLAQNSNFHSGPTLCCLLPCWQTRAAEVLVCNISLWWCNRRDTDILLDDDKTVEGLINNNSWAEPNKSCPQGLGLNGPLGPLKPSKYYLHCLDLQKSIVVCNRFRHFSDGGHFKHYIYHAWLWSSR